MCACVEPVGTAIGAVCVEYGRPKWSITMLNHTHCTEECFVLYFWHPMLVRPVMKRLFFPWNTKEKKARFARAPRDYCNYLYRAEQEIRPYRWVSKSWNRHLNQSVVKELPRAFNVFADYLN